MAHRERLPIPSFDPPPEVVSRQTRKASVKDRPLPPTPVDEERSRHETSSSIGHRGYRRDQVRQQYARHDTDARRYTPEWHNPQYEHRPRKEPARPSNHFLNDKFERDHPHNFHHNPPHYKPSIRQEKKYHKLREPGKRPNPLARCSNAIVSALEEAFYWLGYLVAKKPWVPIVVVIVVTGAFGYGIRFLNQETDGAKLWVPSNALGLQDSDLAREYFPFNLPRRNTLIVTADNVLSTTSLSAMADLHESIISINENTTDSKFSAVCERLGNQCSMLGLLELWNFDVNTIRGLDQTSILNTINTVKMSPVYNIPFDVTKYISDIERDAAGSIVSAKASQMIYILRFGGSGGNETLSEPMQDWELGFLEVGEKGHPDLEVFRFAFRSRADEGFGAIFGDIALLSSGYAVVIIFVMLVLGRFNRVEHKVFVSLTGIMCIVMALGAAIGLGSYAKLVYSQLNSILPFLLLGLGVDDMFVIVGALDNLTPHQKKLPIPERMGFVLKSAGVSITVTSLTDMLAFGVGISTNLPALRSFCTYCLMGILFTFIFQCTFFVAWLSVDERRADAHRDACLFCLKIRRWSPNACSNFLFVKSFFRRFYSRFITHIAVKVIVVLLTAGLLAGGIYGTINLEQDSDWTNFIPGGSYLLEFDQAADKYFPSSTDGISSSVYLIDVDYYNNYTLLEKLHKDLEALPYTENGTTRSWWYTYRGWLNTSTDSAVIAKTDNVRFPSTEDDFYDILINNFLMSPGGALFQQDIVLNSQTNRIIASRNRLRHYMLSDTTEQIRAMDSTREVVSQTGLPRENAFAYARQYLNYEGNKAIQQELYRNLGLAFLCVAVMTLILIANILTSLFICLCVIMTVVDVGGMIFFWGLTIDTVTSIILILAMGLSIDFAAHVGHTFMTTLGSRNERVRRTTVLIGPAVFFGGLSTFLAFLLLVFSKTYVFKTFFKVFLGIVLFGLWHGLAFLPVILSIIGPRPYMSAHHHADGDRAEDRGREGWDEKDRGDEGLFDPRPAEYSYRSDPRPGSSPGHSSLQSAGYLHRSHMDQDRQRRSGRGDRHWPSHSSHHANPHLQGYIPRATAFNSRRFSEGRNRQLMGNGTSGTPRYYVKPMSYSKPAMFIKPVFREFSDGPWPPPKRRF